MPGIPSKVVTCEQFRVLPRCTIGGKEKTSMAANVQVGSILMKAWPGMPPIVDFETDSRFGDWSLVKVADAFALERKIHAAGWNFFFMAAEVKVMFFGFLGAARIQRALTRILARVKQQHFNSIEVTGIVARRFLGVPYVTVSAHSRHMQQSWDLNSPESRQTSEDSATWARG
jgi:hypothetical protein